MAQFQPFRKSNRNVAEYASKNLDDFTLTGSCHESEIQVEIKFGIREWIVQIKPHRQDYVSIELSGLSTSLEWLNKIRISNYSRKFNQGLMSS